MRSKRNASPQPPSFPALSPPWHRETGNGGFGQFIPQCFPCCSEREVVPLQDGGGPSHRSVLQELLQLGSISGAAAL